MNRRKTLQTLLGAAAGAALVVNSSGCETSPAMAAATEAKAKGYGLRTAYEAEREAKLMNETFFTDDEKTTLGVLADIIVPGNEEEPKATDTRIVDFLEFMAIDLPDYHQTILRGGLMWINIEASRRFAGKSFVEIDPAQRIEIVEDIAWPEEAKGTEFEPGAKFFDRMRFLTVTGYFTSKEGIKTLDYQGNQANVWDGVPQEVLDKHGLEYDPKYLPLYVDQSKRDIQAEWDDDMNLIT